MRYCERCGVYTNVTIMSWFNTQTICLFCSDNERMRPDFDEAREADEAACRAGNFNFEGIGLKDLNEGKE